jgi:ABC-type transport system involved in multi-copper enzyme maturation permease subunit
MADAGLDTDHNRGAMHLGRFLNAGAAVASFTTVLFVRRRRTWIMGAMILFPAMLPPIAAYYIPDAVRDNLKLFVALTDFLYLFTLAPLAALFYACSLLSEEIEGRTFPLLLSRATPRSAIVLGKYVAFLLVASILLAVSLVLLFLSCAWWLELSMSGPNAGLLARYTALTVLTVAVYGAFCLTVSTMTRYPVIISALFIFGWEKLVIALPGYADFLTFQKYVQRLMPAVPFRRIEIEKIELPAELLREVYPVGAQMSIAVLFGSIVVLLVIACWVVRSREFASAAEAA